MPPHHYDRIKRSLDIVVAVFLIIATLPLQIGIACAIALTLGRPIFFHQPRPGHNARIFTLTKFRTMKNVPNVTETSTDANRLTRLGHFLRSTSLDELPTLFNVLTGDMSLVGPRPLLTKYLDLYSPTQARRHDVRPGITGLAQINGRNALNWDEKFALDVMYVDNRSFSLDLIILAKTLLPVLRRHGIHAEGVATVEEFRGAGLSEAE